MKNFNLDELFKCPEYRVTGESEGIKEIYYKNEPYKGKATEVFAYLGHQLMRHLPPFSPYTI